MSTHSVLSWAASTRSADKLAATHEGGIVHQVDPLTHLRRFLILGTGNTFYTPAPVQAFAATETIDRLIAEDPAAVLALVLEVSEKRLAIRKDALLYTLARLTLPDVELEVRRKAATSVATVARIATDLLHWIDYRMKMGTPRVTVEDGQRRETRGYSNATFRRAIRHWFESRDPDELALQAIKYEQRDGVSLRDALRLSKAGARVEDGTARATIYDWIAHPDRRPEIDLSPLGDEAHRLFDGWSRVREEGLSPAGAANVVRIYRLPREAVPGALLAHKEVWRELVPDMPARATVRNLGKLGSLELLRGGESFTQVIATIQRAARTLHPFEFLIAASTYSRGRGLRGKNTWPVNNQVTETLAQSFGPAFAHLPVHENLRPLVCLDTSLSMNGALESGLSCTEAGVALLAVLAYQFPQARFAMFDTTLREIAVRGKSQRQLMKEASRYGGGTNCSLALEWAAAQPEPADGLVVITDSETRPLTYGLARLAALRARRPDFKMAVVAMATNEISIADPNDPHSLDLVGLDASLPTLVSGFLSGEV